MLPNPFPANTAGINTLKKTSKDSKDTDSPGSDLDSPDSQATTADTLLTNKTSVDLLRESNTPLTKDIPPASNDYGDSSLYTPISEHRVELFKREIGLTSVASVISEQSPNTNSLFGTTTNNDAGTERLAFLASNTNSQTSSTDNSPTSPTSVQTESESGTPTAPFAGETQADQQWIDKRNDLFDALRNDYQEQLAAAEADRGGIGWRFRDVTNDAGETRNEVTGYVTPSGELKPLVIVRHDREGKPVYGVPRNIPRDDRGNLTGGYSTYYQTIQTGGFVESVFKDYYESQPNRNLEAIAQHYNTDSADALLELHPDLFNTAISSTRSPYAGPGLEGFAMAPPDTLAMVDIQLSDPDVQELINRNDEPVPPPSNPTARAQMHLYGEQRYEQMVRYSDTMQLVRNTYVSHLRQGTQDDFLQADTAVSRLANTFIGASTTVKTGENSDNKARYVTTFTAPEWELKHSEYGGWLPMTYADTRSINLDRLPDLADSEAVSFIPGVGWVTPQANVENDFDWVTDLGQLAIVGTMSYISGGFASGFASGLFGTGTFGAAVGGAAISGAANSIISGAVYGNFDWDDVLKGAFTGALTSGLNQIPQIQQLSQAGPLGNITSQTLTGGAISEITGGDFEQGAINGLVSGISSEMLGAMNTAIDQSGISGIQEIAARQTARMVSSAVRIAHMDGHPGQLFAQEFISGLVEEAANTPGDNGLTAVEEAYALGVSGGEAIANQLSSTPTVEEAINQVAEVVIDSTSIVSGETTEQFINDNGVQYRIETSSDGIVRIYVEGQTDPIHIDVVHDIVETNSNGVLTQTPPRVLQLPSGQRILIGSLEAIQTFGNQIISAGAEYLATLTPSAIIVGTTTVLIGLVIPGNIGQPDYQVYQLNEDSTTRLRTLPGETTGDLQILGPDGEWITTDTNVSFDQLTDEQLELINGPIVGPDTDPVDTGQFPGFPDQSEELSDNTAGGGFQELEGAGEGTVLPNPIDEDAGMPIILTADEWQNKPPDALGTGEYTEFGQPIFVRPDETVIFRGNDGRYYELDVFEPEAVPLDMQSLADSRLPFRQNNAGPTAGVIDLPNGEVVFFSSGASTGPGSRWLDPQKPALNQTGSHAEGHAAAYMMDNNLTELTITINNRDGPCFNCQDQLPNLMPAGTQLNVRFVDEHGITVTETIYGRKNG